MTNTNSDTAIGRIREALTRLVPVNVPKRRARVPAKGSVNNAVTKVAVFTDSANDSNPK